MSKPSDDLFDVNAYQKQLVEALVLEVYTLLLADKKVFGEAFCISATKNFLSSFIATLVYNGLKNGAAMSGDAQAQYESTVKIFSETKTHIEEAVAEGFGGAFQLFNPGTLPDYDCKVTCLDEGTVSGVTQ